MADKDKFYGVPVFDPKLLSQIKKNKPAGRYYDPYPLKGIDTIPEEYYRKSGHGKKNGIDQLAGHANIEHNFAEINPDPNFLNNQYGTLVHEQQHLIDEARGRKESLYPFPKYISFGDRVVNKPTWVSDAEWENYTDNKQKEIENYLWELNDKYLDKYKLSADFPSGGTIAELKRIHETTPGGIMATDLGQDLFGKYPELKNPFFSRIRPESAPYMIEETDSPSIAPIKEVPKVDEAKSKSIIDTVRDYMKKSTTYKKGGKVKLPDGYKKGGNSGLI